MGEGRGRVPVKERKKERRPFSVTGSPLSPSMNTEAWTRQADKAGGFSRESQSRWVKNLDNESSEAGKLREGSREF
jgi:hypothetical protein